MTFGHILNHDWDIDTKVLQILRGAIMTIVLQKPCLYRQSRQLSSKYYSSTATLPPNIFGGHLYPKPVFYAIQPNLIWRHLWCLIWASWALGAPWRPIWATWPLTLCSGQFGHLSPGALLVDNLGNLAPEHPMVANLGNLALECTLAAYLGNLGLECPLVANLGNLAPECPSVATLGILCLEVNLGNFTPRAPPGGQFWHICVKAFCTDIFNTLCGQSLPCRFTNTKLNKYNWTKQLSKKLTEQKSIDQTNNPTKINWSKSYWTMSQLIKFLAEQIAIEQLINWHLFSCQEGT